IESSSRQRHRSLAAAAGDAGDAGESIQRAWCAAASGGNVAAARLRARMAVWANSSRAHDELAMARHGKHPRDDVDGGAFALREVARADWPALLALNRASVRELSELDEPRLGFILS